MLTLDGVDADVLVSHSRRRAWVNLLARLKTGQLDSQLAEGLLPESSDVLFSHARHIVHPRRCALLASSLRRVVADSRHPGGLSRRVPLAREDVQTAQHELLALAERLEQPGPIRCRGVAQIRLLLGDGTGPMYRHHYGRQLFVELRDAARHL